MIPVDTAWGLLAFAALALVVRGAMFVGFLVDLAVDALATAEAVGESFEGNWL